MGMSASRVDGDHKIVQENQLSRPILELCGRHVIMLQMEVPQVALFRQLA